MSKENQHTAFLTCGETQFDMLMGKIGERGGRLRNLDSFLSNKEVNIVVLSPENCKTL